MIADALVSLFPRRSLENPSLSLADPQAWLDMEDAWDEAMGGGGSTLAGIHVGTRTAMQYAPFWRGVWMLSADVAKVPIKVYRVTDGAKEEAREHPAWRVLRRPNPGVMPRYVFWRAFMLHAILGNGLAYIQRDGAGRPLRLILMESQRTDIETYGGLRRYRYHFADGRTETYGAADVFHVLGQTRDGMSGLPLVRYAKQFLARGLAMERYGAAFFGNNAESGVVIEFPGKLNDDALQRMSRSWKASHQGIERSHRPAILEQGAKVSSTGSKARDAQLNESEEASITAAANWLGMPQHKLGHTAPTSYNSLEHEDQAYLDQSLDPWYVAIEDEAHEKLLTEQERDSEEIIVEYVRAALVRADLTSRFSAYQTALAGSPFMTQNEIRRRENLPPIEGGDELKGAAAIVGGAVPMPQLKEQPNKAQPDDEDDEEEDYDDDAERTKARVAMGRVLLDALERASRRIAHQAKRAAGKPREFLAWLDGGLRGDLLPVNEIIGEAAERYAEMRGCNSPLDMRKRMAERIILHWREWLLERAGECKADQLQATIEKRAMDFAPQAARAVFDGGGLDVNGNLVGD